MAGRGVEQRQHGAPVEMGALRAPVEMGATRAPVHMGAPGQMGAPRSDTRAYQPPQPPPPSTPPQHPWAQQQQQQQDFVFKHPFTANVSGPTGRSPASEECALGTVDLVIILDASTSVFEHNFKKVLAFVKDLLKDANFGQGGVRVGVAIFSTTVQIQFHLDRYNTWAEISDAIDDIPFIYGSTNTADSLIAMRTRMFTAAHGDRPGVPNVCIIVTDGVSTVNADRTIPEAELARAEGIHIYAIGVGLPDRVELDAMASRPASVNSFTVENFDQLRGLNSKIFRTICPDTTPAPATTTRPPVTTTSPATCGLSKVDAILILDASTSVTAANFKKMLAFCKDLVDKADVDSGSVRFGALIYSTDVEIQFHLNAYTTAADVKAAIDRIPYIYGSTNSADGLATMHYDMFTADSGDRAGVDNVAFMITDGVSNINGRRTIPEAEDARAAGIHIYAIGIGLSDTRELDAMATVPAADNSFNVKEFDELAGLAESIFTSGAGGQCATTTTAAPETTTALQTTPAACGLADVDIVIILDASTSVTVTNFKKMLAFVKDLLKDAPIDSGSARVAALIYSTEVEIQFHLNQYATQREVFNAIDNIPYIYGSTNSADGLATMHNEMFTAANGDRAGVNNVAFMITDGVSNINARRTIPEAEAARAANIHIYAIGIGLTDTRELDAMASTPFSENSFNVQEFDELEGLADRIFGQDSAKCAKRKTTQTTTTEVITTTTTTTTTTTVPTTTSMEVEVTTPAPCGLARTDIVLVLDASTSVTEANFQKMRQFVKDFLSTADIDSGSVRAGVAIYSTEVEIMFHLDAYQTKAAVMAAIDDIPYIYGSTNTADAVRTMRDDMFTYTRGDRPDVANVGIIITDGVSNINSRRTIPEAEQARDVGIHIYAIGIGLSDTRELDSIASVPASANSFNVQSFDELEGLENVIFNAVCPMDGNWAAWDDWSECPVTCGASTQIRVRSCTDPAPSNGGLFCEGEDMEYRECDAGACPVDGGWSDWEQWSECSEPCGGGRQSATRTCTHPAPRHGGADCTGRASKSRSCNNQPCAQDGGWAAWGVYGPCSVTCDGGDQTRYRTCTAPEPQNGGAPCAGPAYQTRTCNDDPCPIDGMWSAWGDWGKCSMTCGGGDQDRKRYCTNPAPQDGGQYCRGQAGQTRSCNDEPCPTPRTVGYDVIFVLDSSVTPEHFRWMLEYTRSAVREMAIDNGMFRVGLLIYSGGAYKQFDLNEFDTKDDVNAALRKIGYRPGTKNTAAALKFARKRMFRGMNGDRDFAKNFVVLLTGAGDSTDKFAAANEACQLQAEGVGMFSVGLGPISDLSELDAYSSMPTHDYEILIQSEDTIGEVPGLMLYNLKRSTPEASPCPTLPPTTQRPPRPKGKCSSTGDIVFILDSSGSVGQANFYRLLNFTYETVDGLDVDSGNFRVGVVTFSDTSRTAFHLGDFTTLAALKTGLSQVGYVYGNTNTAHALRRARMEMFTGANGDRPDIANVVVIITDGQSNVNHEMTITEARSLKAAGVTVITVAVGFTSETSELVGITSPPVRENLIYVEDYESLGKLRSQLIEPLCTDSDLCRSKPCQNGAICMDGIRSFSCLCPTDYFGDTCNKHCGEPADVVIILDSSTSVGEYNFGRLKEYAAHLVREMNKDACSINVGFLKYSSAAMVQVYLGMHSDTETNIRALEQISYTRGRANMAAAFRTLRTEMFNGRGGDRPEARNIAYLLTDGTNDVHAELTEPEAELTISSGVRIIPIGINLREKYELENIASAQGIQLIEINDEPALIENTDVILNPLFGGNDFCIENPCLNDGTCVNEPFGFVCECRVGYTGDTCQKRCSAKGDVVIAVDTSRYVSRREMKKVRSFLRSIIKRMRFKKGAFNVGVVEFSDWSKVRLDFTTGTSKRAVKASIAGLRVHGGDPEPAQALAKANYRIFNRRGDSGEKPNYLLLVTKSMRNEIAILDEANKLKIQGTRILGVGLGLTTAERDFLQSTVSMPYTDTALFADDADDLKALSDRIIDYMCDDKDLCAENPCRNGGKCQQLGGDFYCDCGSGYAGRYCENRCNARADVVFLLDSSGSVGHVDFRRVKQFVHSLVGELTIDKDHTRVGLATYSSKSRHGFFLREYYNKFDLQNAIAGIRYEYGNTNTAAGLRLIRDHYFAGQHGDRALIQNFLVVITDGLSNVVPDQTLVEAGLIKDSGVHVYAIGVGSFDPFEINHIASAPSSENAYLLTDYSSLGNITSSIVRKTCRDPTVCDLNPCTNGGVCIPGINGPICECLPGFRGQHCDQPCTKLKDIMFLLDSSDSVGADNFQASLTFINSIVEEFSSKDTDNRFSLMTFSDKVQIVFSLGRYRDLRIIKNAIKYTRYRPGNTNIADALRTAIEISVPRLGDRGNAENIVFLLTDGESNVNQADTIPAADDLKATGARVITIGVNMDRTAEIERIASQEEDVYKVATYNDLGNVREDLLAKACTSSDNMENTDVEG